MEKIYSILPDEVFEKMNQEQEEQTFTKKDGFAAGIGLAALIVILLAVIKYINKISFGI